MKNCKVAFIRPEFRNLKEWCEDPRNVYIARRGVVFVKEGDRKFRYPERDSLFANPFKVGKNGTRTEVIDQYRVYITRKLEENEDLVEELLKLRGKNLGCWCHPEACHGDVLLEMIERYS